MTTENRSATRAYWRAMSAAISALLLIGLALAVGNWNANATDTQTVSSLDGASLVAPTAVVVGTSITMSGTGWTTGDAARGSIIAVKLDSGGVSTTIDVVHPETGAVQGNKTIIALIEADADGSWSAEVALPTSENSTANWAAGERHSVTLLTGSMRTGDQIRSLTAEFDIESESAPSTSEPPATSEPPVTSDPPVTSEPPVTSDP
ncbi:MAG: hypothetical protein ACK5MR_14830, partial [Cumulibacter sp.]